MQDALGNALSTRNPATRDGLDDFVLGFLAYDRRPVNLLPAAEADPENALANTYAAALWMFLESPAAPARAAPWLARARAALPAANARERANLAVVEAWVADDIPRATALGEAALREYPRDLALLKLVQYLHFNRGDFPSMLRCARLCECAAADVPQFHGMLAFALEQCHLLAEAEAAARHALAMTRAEPWAQHALAHVMLTQGRIEEGRTFLEAHSDTWAGLNSFMYTHNWWHLALFMISEGRLDEAVAIHDAHVWAVDRAYSQDQVGAVSLLARLEFAGAELGTRWEEAGASLADRAQDTTQPFLSLQYLFGLARAGRPEAATLAQAIAARAAKAPPHTRAAWADVAAPAARGIVAFCAGDDDTAIRELGPALPRMLEVGGSHAQRDLFEQIHLAAVLRAGRDVTAQQLLEVRRGFEPNGVPLNRALAGVYARLGLPREAATAAARAARA